MGYFAEQTTKPQTIGDRLTESLVGLLAWVYEKLICLTDSYWSFNFLSALILPSEHRLTFNIQCSHGVKLLVFPRRV